MIINGNDRLYEDIVRRELRTKPGMLFSRDDSMRSTREIAQMGHFDPENLVPQPIPDPDNGTVDIQYNLVSKANDQIEFSAGWGQTGVIGKLSLKFTNFSMKNLLNPSTYKGIIPQGEGADADVERPDKWTLLSGIQHIVYGSVVRRKTTEYIVRERLLLQTDGYQ